MPLNRLVKQAFDRSTHAVEDYSGQSKTLLKSRRLMERLGEAEKLLQDSHSKPVLQASDGFLHPAFEQSGRQFECLVQWIIGATDTYEDIGGQMRPADGATPICRLCGQASSIETKAHLLTTCVKTVDLRMVFLRKVPLGINRYYNQLSSVDQYLYILACCSPPHKVVKKLQKVSTGLSIISVPNMIDYRESLGNESIQIFLHSETTPGDMLNSVAMEIRRENCIEGECFKVASHAGEIERLSIVLSQALETLLDGRNPRTLDIRLVSTSMQFIDYLKEIKP